jgi:hypothetical protein
MDHARFALALPDDPDLLGRLTAALKRQADPSIALVRSGEAVVAFESATSDGTESALGQLARIVHDMAAPPRAGGAGLSA